MRGVEFFEKKIRPVLIESCYLGLSVKAIESLLVRRCAER
jgi:hypothetical protein